MPGQRLGWVISRVTDEDSCHEAGNSEEHGRDNEPPQPGQPR